jgi:hypothetical protein
LESGYTSHGAAGYILKCLDGSSTVTFNTSRYVNLTNGYGASYNPAAKGAALNSEKEADNGGTISIRNTHKT